MMTNPEITASEAWRILVVRHEGSEILVRSDGLNLRLPQVDIPAQERIAANINRAMEQDFGLRLVCLYEINPGGDGSSSDDLLYHAASAVDPGQNLPHGAHWRNASALTPNSFSCGQDFLAIDAFRRGLESGTAQSAPEPFLKPDWFAEVTGWIRTALQRNSLHLTGPFRQFNASPVFSLIRFETTETPVWFKAVGAPNLREFSATLALARLCPRYLPRILASEPAWNAWLAAQASGNSLMSQREMRFWERAASSLASLEIATIGETHKLLNTGARDLRVAALHSRVEPFFRFITKCSTSLPPDSAAIPAPTEISELKATVRLAIKELERLCVFETVGHMDLNPANIYCSDECAVFLDWAEAFVGCPLFSYQYLLQHFRRVFSADLCSEKRLRAAYLQPWQRILFQEQLDRAFALSPLLALFTYAISVWSSASAEGSLSPSRQSYLLSLVRRMKREAAQSETERVSL